MPSPASIPPPQENLMTPLIRRLCAAAVLALVAGCATGYAPTPYWTIRDTAFDGLRPGLSTKADVRKALGVPLSEMNFPRQREDVWEYRYLEGTTRVALAYVHFDPQGVYKYSHRFLDPAYYGGAEF
jgi:outer membrane protein assembly factor BamE (lipoprotein component of BamABCDE complex)